MARSCQNKNIINQACFSGGLVYYNVHSQLSIYIGFIAAVMEGLKKSKTKASDYILALQNGQVGALALILLLVFPSSL